MNPITPVFLSGVEGEGWVIKIHSFFEFTDIIDAHILSLINDLR
jgi:hypothetical protein